MAISLNYRGDVRSKDSGATVGWLKRSNKCKFVEWVPTGFKIGLNSRVASILPDDDIGYSIKNLVMTGNNTLISRIFHNRLSVKYDLMFSQKAFVHWYVKEGVEEGEFQEARENLEFLEKDYQDVLADQLSDEPNIDDDDNDHF